MAPEGIGSARSFQRVLTDAMREFAAHGYQSESDLADWIMRLRASLEYTLLSDAEINAQIRATLGNQFARLLDDGGIGKFVPGVSRYTIDRVRPALRAELDRRILSSVNLIKLNRTAAVDKTLQRFSGWATAIPAGGDTEVEILEPKARIAKEPAQIRFEARRVAIDQGAKLVANISEIVAVDSGAIAAIWHDRGEHDKNYDARKEHLSRSGKMFLLKDSWARKRGLVRSDGRPYIDDMERPAQLPFCSCFYQWVTSLRRLPDEFLTRAGQEWIATERNAA